MDKNLQSFMDFYHAHPRGAQSFFDDAYSRFDEYETNLGLQSEMLNHSLKHVGQYAAQNPGVEPTEIKRHIKQQIHNMETEAYNDPGSHLNGQPEFSSMFHQAPEPVSTGIDVSGASSALRQKQERGLQNREVMQQFGVTPKPKTEGNNVVNAIDRFRMKKSEFEAQLIEALSDCPPDIDDFGLGEYLAKSDEYLEEHDVDEVTNKLHSIQQQMDKRQESIASKESAADKKVRQIKENNQQVFDKYENVENLTQQVEDAKKEIMRLMYKLSGKR